MKYASRLPFLFLFTTAIGLAQAPGSAPAPATNTPARSSFVKQGDLDDSVATPKADTNQHPYYPKQLRDAGIKGEVVVEVTVDRYGGVSSPRVIRSDRAELDMLAIEAVLSWQFDPAVVNNQVVPSTTQVTVKFDPADAENNRKARLAKTRGKPNKKLPPEYQYDEAPVLVRSVKPVYPYDFLLRSKTGRATVTFIVDRLGNAREAQVETASEPEFGAATAAMVEAMKFEPATKAGKPCSALLTFEQVFNQIGATSPVDEPTKDLVQAINKGSAKIYAPTEVDAMPKPTFRVPPELPEGLRKSGEAAAAQIEVIIDLSGRARLPRVLTATHDNFGWAAATAASRWMFQPVLKDGQPVYLRVVIPFKYTPPKK
ncbi:MAG: TonB family protein [Opitutaceae bacterium]|nr:TonB family protein [Opitutaceae bacterium]